MSNTQNSDVTDPPVGQRRCPKCGLPMFLLHTLPSKEVDHAERTFECTACPYGEMVTIKLR